MTRITLAGALVALSLAAATSLSSHAAPLVFSGSGAQVADLTATVDTFRATLGANLGGAPNPGLLPGRREINWDAEALDAVADPNLMPADQFNGLAAPFARGAQFTTPGSGFFVSRRCEQDGGAPGCGGNNILLGMGPDAGLNVNFRAFSEQRIFTPVGSNLMDITFAVPGSPGAAATTSAFGAVFLDVETATLTTMQLFDAADNLLGTFEVPVAPDAGFSFLGVVFGGGEQIARVRLTLGDMVVTGHGTFDTLRNDIVALDDFIYAEPVAAAQVAEPPALALLALAGLAAAAGRRGRRDPRP